MNDETEPKRQTIHVFDIDLETGDVPVRELHVVDEVQPPHSILRMELGPALKKLDDAQGTRPRSMSGQPRHDS